MNLTTKPENIVWPQTHYVFIEKQGPFMETAREAWETLHSLTDEISAHNKIKGYTSLYKPEAEIYRAGVVLVEPPRNLPKGVDYVFFQGGKYARFVLRGSYSDLPEACGRVFEIAEEKLDMRDDFCIENYLNDPRTTPEEKLVTEILIPTK